MAEPYLFVQGRADSPDSGLLTQRPGAGPSTFGMRFWATDTLQLFACVLTAPGVFTWKDITGGAGAAYSFVYQQGGVQTGRIFTSFAGAVAAAQASGGPAVILIDGSLGQPVTTPGAYNLKWIKLWGNPTSPTGTTLNVVNGTTFQNLTYLSSGMILKSFATTAPVITDAATVLVMLEGSALLNDVSATKAFISVPAAGTAFLDVDDDSLLQTNAAAHPILFTDAAATASVLLRDDSRVTNNSLGNAGGGAITLFVSDSSAIVPTILAANVTQVLLTNAFLEGYTATGGAGVWGATLPGNVNNAVDRIAAAVAGILGGTIP